ncbi:carbonic anhydrase [Cadophora sp. DSE1049]|nr:carbonic anhydrase [Cadophora sp. DSE1049]
MRSSTSTLALLFATLFLDSASASCGHGTSLLKRKVNYKRQEGGEAVKVVEVGQFGYIGSVGPTNWAALAAENGDCAVSKQQSPIDVTNTSTTLVAPGALDIKFPNVAAAEFENIGTTIEVVMEGKGAETIVDGKAFELKQFHFHSPSEHTVNGEYFPLEMHMVHEAADGAIAVIAAQFQLSETGETTSLLTSVVEKIGAISAPGSVTETGALDFAPLVDVLSKQSLSTYAGSLTTPPCAEGLTFFITTEQLALNVATFNQIKAVVGFNARFTQNVVGQDNLLAASAKVVAQVEAAAGGAEAVVAAPVAEAAEPAAEVAEPVAEAAKPAVAEGAASTATGSNVITAGSLGEASEIVKGLTGLDLGALLGN